MANPPIPNIWHLRTVADVSAKPCIVCFRPSTAVLITPDSKDFFYVCRGHLKDRGFAAPLADPAAEAAAKKKRDDEAKAETDRVVAEWRAKQAEKEKKKEKGKDKKDEGEKDKDKDKDKKEEDKKEKEDKTKEGEDKPTSPAAAEEIPRIYALHRNFYNMRLDRLRKAEMAKRTRELLRDPQAFPAVPKNLP